LPLIALIDTHTHTLSKTPVDEGLAHLRDLYMTIHSTHTVQSFMPPVKFQPAVPAIPASEWLQTHILD